jgi:DNA-binding LytR/AlgR family response regulator
MVQTISDINRVAVCDDNSSTRDDLSSLLEIENFQPFPLNGPYNNIDQVIQQVIDNANAAICDYQIDRRNYATFNGAEVVSNLYARKVPALLITMYGKAEIDHIRLHRHRIPVILKSDADIDEIAHGFEVCVSELNEKFSPERKPWQTLVRIEEIDTDRNLVDSIIPAWNSKTIVRFPLALIPHALIKYVQPGERFYAQVNTGTENYDDLFLFNFSYRGKFES